MKKSTKEIIGLTSKELLLSFFDIIPIISMPFTKDFKKRIEIADYLEERGSQRSGILRKISYLRRRGIISQITESKESYLELTAKGFEYLKKHAIGNLCINKPEHWDKKWRVVMFDIPEKDRDIRDFIRLHLYKLGFRQVQKSVFVFPYECSTEINYICEQSGGRKYIKYMIADIVEGETDLIEHFLDAGVLTKNSLI